MHKMTFGELCEALLIGEEIGFGYNNTEYEFVHSMYPDENKQFFLYLMGNPLDRKRKICPSDEKEAVINFLKTYKINNKTIKQIFEEGLNY